MKVMEKLTPDVKILIKEYNEIGTESSVREINLKDTTAIEIEKLILKAIKEK